MRYCMSVCLSVSVCRLLLYLCICLSVCLSVCVGLALWHHEILSVCLSVSVCRLLLYLCICLSVCVCRAGVVASSAVNKPPAMPADQNWVNFEWPSFSSSSAAHFHMITHVQLSRWRWRCVLVILSIGNNSSWNYYLYSVIGWLSGSGKAQQ